LYPGKTSPAGAKTEKPFFEGAVMRWRPGANHSCESGKGGFLGIPEEEWLYRDILMVTRM